MSETVENKDDRKKDQAESSTGSTRVRKPANPMPGECAAEDDRLKQSAMNRSPSEPPVQKIGYKSPPLHTRFKPKQSGNPSGRPKSTDTKSAVLKGLSKQVSIVENGVQRLVTISEVIAMAVLKKAMTGELRYYEMVLALEQQENERREFDDEINSAAQAEQIFHAHDKLMQMKNQNREQYKPKREDFPSSDRYNEAVAAWKQFFP